MGLINEFKKYRDNIKKEKIENILSSINLSYLEDEEAITLVMDNNDNFSFLSYENFCIEDEASYYMIKKRLNGNKKVILKLKDLIIDENKIFIDPNFCITFNVEFENCTFKNGISQFLSIAHGLKFTNCTFESEQLSDNACMTMSKSNWCIYHVINFDGCKFNGSVVVDSVINFKNCEFNGKILCDEFGHYNIITKLSFESCKFKEPISIIGGTQNQMIGYVKLDGCTFDSNLTVDSDEVIIVGNNVISGDTDIKANELSINTCILRSKNIYLKPNTLVNSYDFHIEADESVTIDGDDTKEYIISSPKVVLNGYDVSTDNNSLVDVYPNERYKLIKENEKTIRKLKTVRKMIYDELEKGSVNTKPSYKVKIRKIKK